MAFVEPHFTTLRRLRKVCGALHLKAIERLAVVGCRIANTQGDLHVNMFKILGCILISWLLCSEKQGQVGLF